MYRPRRQHGPWLASSWAAAEDAPTMLTAEQWMAADDATAPSVSFTVPGSIIFPATGAYSLLCARNGMVGGTLARAHVSATIGGVERVIDIGHGGSIVDARDYVVALSGAQRTAVDLGSSTVDAETVATEIVNALALDGVTATTEDAGGGRWRVTIENATDLVVPPDVDNTDIALRGMRGGYRDNWGNGLAGQALNGNGGTGGTGSVHVGQLGTAGRLLAGYVWTRTDTVAMEGRLAASAGPAYSVTPGAMTPLAEAEQTIQGFGTAVYDVVSFDGTERLWAQYASDTATAGIRFRLHGQAQVGRGDLGAGELLIWDTTRPASSATPLGSSYTPTVDATFGIYVMIGLIVEHPDLAGNYPANGRWLLAIGDHNTDPTHGTTFPADATILTGENTGHRVLVPPWPQIRAETVSRVVDAIGSDEDSRVAVYQHFDLLFPPGTAAALVSDLGQIGIDVTGTPYIYSIPGGLELGTDTVSGSRYLAWTWNYLRDGGNPTVFTLGVFLDVVGDGYFGNAWTDERGWHDHIPGATEIAEISGVIEFRTRAADGNVGQPVTWGVAYTDPMDPTGYSSPPAIARDLVTYVIDGIIAD